jgi:hypothetical protein
MDLYIFCSTSRKNISIGVKNRKWAVSDIDTLSMKTRFSKSLKMLRGSRGLFYCSERGGQHFTVPFRTLSQPKSVAERISGVWAQPWALPFDIEPLGPSYRSESLEVARRSWSLFEDVSNITQITPVGGRYAFNACSISEVNWEEIIRRLGYRDGDKCE